MRIAVLADVHGNIHALEASLEEIEKQKVDKIVLAGDLLNGLPNSKKCLDLINSKDIIYLQGNHERYIFDHDSENAPVSWRSENFAPVRWVRERLSETDLKQIANLKMYIQFDNLLITHAAPNDDYARIRLDSPVSELRKHFEGFDNKFIIKAHNHVWVERTWDNKQLLSIGSNGLAMDGVRKAQFIITEKHSNTWKHQRFFIDYDFLAAIKTIEDSGYASYTPMALLTKQEVLTAQIQVHLFIQKYARALANKEISLKNAVNRFLDS